MFTARYGLSPYVTQRRLFFEMLIHKMLYMRPRGTELINKYKYTNKCFIIHRVKYVIFTYVYRVAQKSLESLCLTTEGTFRH